MVSDAGTTTAPGRRSPLRVILTRRFARQVVTGRWFTVFASLLVMAASGATYIFGSYSGLLKSALGYDQRTLNTVSFFKDLGVFSGLINEVTPPWVVLAVGAAMNLAGYLMVYLAVSGRTARPPLWLVCLYFFAGANSQSFANTGALVTCVNNFPQSRGVVLGILKGFVGLSGALYTQLYYAFYGVARPPRRLAAGRRVGALRAHHTLHAAPAQEEGRPGGQHRPLLLLPVPVHRAGVLPPRHDRGAAAGGAVQVRARPRRHAALHPPPARRRPSPSRRRHPRPTPISRNRSLLLHRRRPSNRRPRARGDSGGA